MNWTVFVDSPGSLSSENDDCAAYHTLNISDLCEWVNTTSDCDIDEGLINYTKLVFCSFSPSLLPLAIFLLFLWWLFLFISLAVVADDFFCPSLVVMSKTLRMSDNIAGVTLLAFGNGAPDVFSALAAIQNSKGGDIGLAIGALLGAGVFVTTVVAGAVCFVKPFHIMERPFLRDAVFYIGAVFFTFVILYDKKITLAESIVFLCYYVVYVIVVVVGRYIYQKQKARRALQQVAENSEEDNEGVAPPEILSSHGHHLPHHDQGHHSNQYSNQHTEATPISMISSNGNINDADDERTPLLHSIEGPPRQSPKDAVGEFLRAVNPLDMEAFTNDAWYWKIFYIVKAPSQLLFTLVIPVVDIDKDKHNWNKYLNTLHCLVAPLIAYSLAASNSVSRQTLGGVFPVWALILLICGLLTIIVMFTSSPHQQPRYHWVFSFAGFAVAVVWIESIANEIVNILQTFGVVFNLSSAVLGLTLLAWGNSIGDLVADTAMAKQGYPRTGISACFAGPLFNLLLGIGLPFTIGTVKNGHSLDIQFTLIQVVLITGLLLSLVFSLIAIPLQKFRIGRIYGACLFAIYVVFIVIAVLVEVGVIKGKV